MHKNCFHQSCSFWLRYNMHQIVCRLGLRPRPHWGRLQRSPEPLAGLGGWGPWERKGGSGGEKEGGEGRESRNVQIQSWQA